jgi:hypothetical protein
MPFRIGLRSRAIRMFIWSARTRTDSLLRSIRVAISAKLHPDIASRRSRSSSEGDHGIPLISFTFSPGRGLLTRGQPCWQTVAIDYCVDFSSSNRPVTDWRRFRVMLAPR